jgi:hypothetical protein
MMAENRAHPAANAATISRLISLYVGNLSQYGLCPDKFTIAWLRHRLGHVSCVAVTRIGMPRSILGLYKGASASLILKALAIVRRSSPVV